MKKTIKLAVVAALALGATSAFATNGSTMIGLGAKSRGMAGATIGVAHGAESGLSNPALITSVEKTEISFGGTIFMPHVSYNNGSGAGSKDSTADMNVIPEISIASKITDNFYIGVGMWGTGGMGVDYRDEAANFKMVTNLQVMQFGVPLAYKVSGLSVAITPLLQYGSLDINYDPGNGNVGEGVAQDLKFGYNLGLAYEISNVTIGAVYKSQIDMDYKNQIPTAGATFGLQLGSKLSTPAEMGLGVSYKLGSSTIALDYKKIKWSDAKGYQDFKWDDQDVYVIGYEYTASTWALRAGYNYAASPISDQGVQNTAINTLNLLGFPAVVESHIALGASYNVSKATSFDFAYTHALENTQTYTASNYPNQGTRQTEVKHSQDGISVQANFKF
ncbi:OmpP1/FadL family transporter [Sulfurimonas sp.]